MQLTILMPCLNEAETLETCIRKANASDRAFGHRRRGADRRQRQHRRLAGIGAALGARVVPSASEATAARSRRHRGRARASRSSWATPTISYDFSELDAVRRASCARATTW